MAYCVLNKSGCAVRKGNCQIRLDFYLDDTDPRYADKYLHLVDTTSPEYLAGYPGKVDKQGNPKDQAAYELWIESLPHIWQNTPFHTHFIYLPATFTQDDIKAAIDIHLKNFYQAFQNRQDEVKGGMRHGWATETRIRPTNYSKTETTVQYDTRVAECQASIDALTGFQYKPKAEGGSGETFPATEIDIGVTDGASSLTFSTGTTYLGIENPANDTGSLDYFEVNILVTTYNVKVGTFYGSGTSRTNRGGYTWGTLTAGVKTASGLDIDVETDDIPGIYGDTGTIGRVTSGRDGIYYKSGDQFGAGTQTFTFFASNCIYLYGTGETVGWSTIAKVCGVTAGTMAKVDGVAVADIAKLLGTAV